MRNLIKGIREFQSSYFQQNQELFEQLGEGQTPSVLFITCSDSRIVPSLIVQADPGDLFVIRNAGNIMPPFGAANGGEGAALEYAIQALNIDQIIVCGHNHCGAMKGLLKLNELQDSMPLVYDWLKHADATRQVVKENYSEFKGEELLDITIAENVLNQMDNLKTYPSVRSRLQQGRLHMYGWIYEIETGQVEAYNPLTHSFEPPQSQLYPEDEGYGREVGPGRFVHTAAPLVASAPVANSNGTRANGSSPNGASAHKAGAEPAAVTPWVSAAQADRIFRGSAN
jgi:carbonic anhydrase